MMQPKLQPRQQCQYQCHETTEDIPTQVIWQPAGLSDDTYLVDHQDEKDEDNDDKRCDTSWLLLDISRRQSVDRDLVHRQICQNTCPVRREVPNHSFKRRVCEHGQRKAHSNAPESVADKKGRQECTKGDVQWGWDCLGLRE